MYYIIFWGKNQSGMQAAEEIDEVSRTDAVALWLEARDKMLSYSEKLSELGVHKQISNRLLEPWMFITVIITATEFENFFHLRSPGPFKGFDPNFPAQPEIQAIAILMEELYRSSIPKVLATWEWHLPFIRENEKELSLETRLKLSVVRCARVSYFNHDGTQTTEEDLRLYDRLTGSDHWSTFEHQAKALGSSERIGNLVGWEQYRKQFPNEHFGKWLK